MNAPVPERSYLDVIRVVRSFQAQERPEWNIFILRDIILEPVLTTYLKFFALQKGMRLQVHYGQYNNILQEIENPANQSLLEKADCVMVFAQLDGISRICLDLLDLTERQVREEFTRVETYIESVLAALRKRTDAMILWSGFEPQIHAYAGILDSCDGIRPAEIIPELNRLTAERLKRYPNAYYFDIQQLILRTGACQFFDLKGWHYRKAPYSKAGCRMIASEAINYLAAGKGMSKKCLVLDCDQTLWGGVIAEDGMDGIRIGKDRGESAYLEFQREILNLYRKGVILALCSKNNEADVWEVFDRHPGMLLKRYHFSSHQINWDPKPVNLTRIAKELRIDLSSMVMVDDSPFEIEQIRCALPEVETIALDAGKPYLHAFKLATCGHFHTLKLTQEDRKRGELYRVNFEREKTRALYRNASEFLSSLNIRAVVKRASGQHFARVAQLSQRANQFNFNKKGLSELDVQRLSQRPDTDLLVLELTDRFGDYGLVGVCVLKQVGQDAFLETFLLSCRAIGRGVEDLLLDAAVQAASARGCTRLIGLFTETEKNVAFAFYYEKKGFRLLKNVDGTRHWELELNQFIPERPPHIHADLQFQANCDLHTAQRRLK